MPKKPNLLQMGTLSSDLSELGYERTERESPFDEDGELWTKGYEMVCDQTGFVIRSENDVAIHFEDGEKEVYRYRNSGTVKMAGGHVSSYDWGEDEALPR